MKMDPLDEHYTYVNQSKLHESGEGLFARTFIPKGTVFAQIGGVLVSDQAGLTEHRQTYVKRIAMFKNVYNITNFDEDIMVIKYATRLEYCPQKATLSFHPEVGANKNHYNATTGHKVNHKFIGTNAELFEPFDSPRYGLIVGLIATRPLQKDKEVFIDYGYRRNGHIPKWYKELM